MQYQQSYAFMTESDMSQITLRNIDPDLLKKIKELAQKENLSMNKFITKILKQALLTGKKKKNRGKSVIMIWMNWPEHGLSRKNRRLNRP